MAAAHVNRGVYHQSALRVRTSGAARRGYEEPALRTRPRVYDDRRVNSAVYDEDGTIANPRSKAKSAAIIGGGAAAGAAIGAMTGGGKGAAIGPLQVAQADTCTIGRDEEQGSRFALPFHQFCL